MLHTIPYDQLPHIPKFDLLNRECGYFLSTDARRKFLRRGPVVSVPLLGIGPPRLIDSYIERAAFRRLS